MRGSPVMGSSSARGVPARAGARKGLISKEKRVAGKDFTVRLVSFMKRLCSNVEHE